MATRVNTKFVLILVIATLTVAGLGCGVWFVQYRRDAGRNARAGDEAMAAGEYEQAYKMYGRAVYKEPWNLAYVDKLEDALLRIRPASHDRAVELDIERIMILRHRTRYQPKEAPVHRALLRELHAISRFTRMAERWQELIDAAQEMDDQLLETDPQRPLALLYRGLARSHFVALQGAGEAEVEEARRDLERFVEAAPDDDLGWASLIQFEMAQAHRARTQGSAARLAEREAQLGDLARRAREAVPEGPETARVLAVHTAYLRERDPASISQQALLDELDRMVALVTAAGDPHLLAESVGLLQALGLTQAWDRAIGLLQAYLEKDPEKHYHRFLLAWLLYLDDELDQAQEAARVVIDSPQMLVGLLGRIQQRLRIQAAGLIVDIEYRRWERAPREEKAAHLSAIEEAFNGLARLVAAPDSEPLYLEAEARVAYANSNFATAAARFERAIELVGTADLELLWYSSRALEQVGQLGRALERMEAALSLFPGNVAGLIAAAGMQSRMGRFDEAEARLVRALELDPRNGEARDLLSQVRSRKDGRPGTDSAEDEVARTLRRSEDAFDSGDVEGARSALLATLAAQPASVPLLRQLAAIELRDGKPKKALEYVERALAAQPQNQVLRIMADSLRDEDQVAALRQYIAERYPNEADQNVHMMVQLRRLARGLEQTADRERSAGNREASEQAAAQAAGAAAEADALLATALERSPDHPLLLEYLFNEALEAQDWPRVEPMVQRAQATDADQAGGLIFKGRYELARGLYAQAAKTLTDATQRKDYSSLPWRLLGRAQEEMGNFAEARRAYARAYTINPLDLFAVRWYVDLLSRTGETMRALEVLREARRSMPDDALLLDYWLQMEAQAGDLALALAQRRDLYWRTPSNRLNALRLASLLGRATPGWEHVVDAQGRVLYDANAWKLLPAEQRSQLLAAARTKWIEEARQILDDLVAQGEDTLAVARVRADLLAGRGEYAPAVEVLRRFAEARTDRAQKSASLIELARFQGAHGHLADGVATLEEARAWQGENREVDRAMAGLYFETRQWERALELFQELLSLGENRDLRLQIVECTVKLRRYDEAEALLARAIDAGGRDFTSEMLAAVIARGRGAEAVAAGRPDDAQRQRQLETEALARAERLDPSSPLPHVQRADALLAEFGRTEKVTLLDEALRSLARADEVQSGSTLTRLARIEVLRARGDLGGAIGELSRLVESRPDDDAVRTRLITLYIESGRLADALSAVDQAIARDPSNATWYEARGDVCFLRARAATSREAAASELREGVKAFRDAYRLEPTAAREVKLADGAMSLDHPDFRTVVEVLVGGDESRLGGRPVLRTMYARALLGLNRRDEALAHLRTAYREFRERIDAGTMGPEHRELWYRTLLGLRSSSTPEEAAQAAAEAEAFARELAGGRLDAWELHWIAGLWVIGGSRGVEKALELQRAAVQASPAQDPLRAVMLTRLGQLLVAAGDVRACAEAFEQALAIDGGDAVTMNNVAFLYAENLGEPSRALSWAEKAAALLPQDANVVDTLGWTYFKLGRLDEAEAQLRKAESLEKKQAGRESATTMYHLARVLHAAGKRQPAETCLLRAAELAPDDDLSVKIAQLRDEMRHTP